MTMSFKKSLEEVNPPTRKIDQYLKDLPSDDSDFLLSALRNPAIGSRKIATALTNIKMPISRDAVSEWRKANGIRT